MAKKKVFRVIGIIKAEETMPVMLKVADHAPSKDTIRLMMGLRIQDRKKKIPYEECALRRIQIDFRNEEAARECREALKPFLVKDSSDF